MHFSRVTSLRAPDDGELPHLKCADVDLDVLNGGGGFTYVLATMGLS